MHVAVDQRIELMGVMQYLAQDELVTRYESVYTQVVGEYFAPYVNHPAIIALESVRTHGFSFDRVPSFFLSRHPLPDFTRFRQSSCSPELPVSATVTIEGFESLVRSLYQDSTFDIFFQHWQPHYQAAIGATAPIVYAAVQALEAYIGTAIAQSSLILGFLLHHGGFGLLFDGHTTHPAAIVLIGPVSVADGVPLFGDAAALTETTQHEFSHPIINPLTARYRDTIEQFHNNHAPIADVLAAQAYPDWETVVNEHIIRAITIRLAARRDGEQVAGALIAQEEQRGFRYIKLLLTRLQEYEQQRSRYPTLLDYYPKLLAGLGQ